MAARGLALPPEQKLATRGRGERAVPMFGELRRRSPSGEVHRRSASPGDRAPSMALSVRSTTTMRSEQDRADLEEEAMLEVRLAAVSPCFLSKLS